MDANVKTILSHVGEKAAAAAGEAAARELKSAIPFDQALSLHRRENSGQEGSPSGSGTSRRKTPAKIIPFSSSRPEKAGERKQVQKQRRKRQKKIDRTIALFGMLLSLGVGIVSRIAWNRNTADSSHKP